MRPEQLRGQCVLFIYASSHSYLRSGKSSVSELGIALANPSEGHVKNVPNQLLVLRSPPILLMVHSLLEANGQASGGQLLILKLTILILVYVWNYKLLRVCLMLGCQFFDEETIAFFT